eukprot:TRINITY_DN81636_c0_g1_i1.p1 TRINITY_DN81636_c0_g1~~TRINITY_DN81636_c0_g1_i1.p1  ORF type:complete len:485 (+),score=26.67 TRINITY_DN81636_c0_g1_i1:23-1456(+)
MCKTQRLFVLKLGFLRRARYTLASKDTCDASGDAACVHDRPLLCRDMTVNPNWTMEHLTSSAGEVSKLEWSPERPFAQYAYQHFNEPVIFTNTIVKDWPALSWTWEGLLEMLNGSELESVKVGPANETFFWVDPNRQFFEARKVGFEVRNMSAETILRTILRKGTDASGYQYLGRVPSPIAADVKPDDFMFLDPVDHERAWQNMWLSTAGSRTHTHFDNDPNFFVQILGTKLFTFFPQAHEHICPFPRFHPLWHKSRMDFEKPCLDICPSYRDTHAFTVRVVEGDMLYLPPFWWHHVVSETASVSLTSYSKLSDVYFNLNSAHSYGLTIDKLRRQDAKQFALRWFLVNLVLKLEPSENADTLAAVHSFFNRLVASRYAGLEAHFEIDDEEDRWMCRERESGKTPYATWVRQAIELDLSILTGHMHALPDPMKLPALNDYIEQVVDTTVGTKKVLSFYRNCMLIGAGFTYENDLWDTA